MLSDQSVSEPVFENTAFLLYINPPYFNLFQLLNMACWAVQSCINASVEEPRSFMRDDVCNTTDSCSDHNLETVYHLFWLSSQTKGKALLIPNIQPLACQGTCGLQFKKPVCSSAVFLVWYFWFIRKSFIPFKDMEKWANGNLMKVRKKKKYCTWGGITACTHCRPRWSLVIQGDQGRWSLSSAQHWSHLACWVQLWASLCKSPAKPHTRMIKGLEYLTHE